MIRSAHRIAFAALTLALAAACAAGPPVQPDQQRAGNILARAQCPERVAEAAAWVNHMPGAGRAPRNLIVSARMENAQASALLLKADDSTDETLVLEIRASPTAPLPGRLGYREPAPNPLYSRVVFRCRGGEVFAITQIDQVY
jgi:hypothetical protein